MPKHIGTGRINAGFQYVKDTFDYRQRIAAAVILAIAVVAIATILLTASASASGPAACSVTEDSQLVDCNTGRPLDYRNGAWWSR
jgi:uncharacterized membrane protein